LDIELSQKLSAIALSDVQAGGPHKPGFGLSGEVLQLDRNLPAALSCFRVVYSDSISTRSPRPVDLTTAGPSTPQIIAFAMICSGRDDRIEKI
jgi:hypothetical protein